MKHCQKFRNVTGLWMLLLFYHPVADAAGWQKTNIGARIITDKSTIEVQFFSPAIVRILKWPTGHGFTKESLSVVRTAEKSALRYGTKGDRITLSSDRLRVEVNSVSGQVLFHTERGRLLLAEKPSGSTFTPFIDAGSATYSVAQTFLLEEDEAIYGLGIQQQGKMNQRNTSLRMIQGNTDDYIPFFQSVKGYGLFWDNYSPTQFTDTPQETSFVSEVGDGIDYYLLYGGDADGVVAAVRDLTGDVPMFPLWSYGYWQSKERYKSQDETVGVVRRYRELGVPLDGIIQDWQYWGNNYLWNAMEFLNPEFYDPARMVEEVHRLHAHLIISIWSSFGPMTKPYRELKEGNMLMDFVTWPQSGSEKWPPNPDYPSGVRVYDAYHPQAREIYWKYLNEGLLSLGMDGWWMDSTEPDHLDGKVEDLDNATYLGSFRKVRNAYPLMSVGGVYTNQRKVMNEKRVFILTRSAFAGQQRYGANVWSGDVVASWDALRNQIAGGLNLTLCGIPHYNSDIGGFFLWNFPGKLQDPAYRELYVRWLQFGAFSPMMRSHGADAPREIWQFGQKGEKQYDAIEKFIRLRYQLLPYIYSTSWEVTHNRSSMMRALVMDFADDKKVLDINDQYLFGKSLLVAPVTRSMYTKESHEDYAVTGSRELYLPAGADWIDFWTGEPHAGGQTIRKESPIDIMPLYVRSGSILPYGPQVQYAEEKPWDSLEIRVYPGADGTFTLYEDEKDNYNYEKGLFSTIPFNWDDKRSTLTIGARVGTFPSMLQARTFHITLVTPEKGKGLETGLENDWSVRYTGKKITIKL